MFNLDVRRRSDRIKLFLLLFFSFLLVSLFVVYLSGGFKEPPQEAEVPPPFSGTEPSEQGQAPALPAPVEPTSPSEERREAKEVLTEEDQVKTQDIARKFAEAHYTYNVEQPEHYIENSQPYLSERLYAAEKSAIRRQNDQTRVIVADVLPVDHLHESEIVWSVVIDGEATAADGSTRPDFVEYFVTLRLYDGEWKVKEYLIESGGD